MCPEIEGLELNCIPCEGYTLTREGLSSAKCAKGSGRWRLVGGAGSEGLGLFRCAGPSVPQRVLEPPSTLLLIIAIRAKMLAMVSGWFSLKAPLCILNCGTTRASLVLRPSFACGENSFPRVSANGRC